MEKMGDIMQGLLKRVQTTRQEQRTYSESNQEDLPQYDCILCRDKEWIHKREHHETKERITLDEYYGGSVNPADAYHWTKEIHVECECSIRKKKQRKIQQLLKGSGMSKRFRKRTFDSILWLDPYDFEDPWNIEVEKLVHQQRDAYNLTLEYCVNFEQHQGAGEGIGLFGDVGTAKTHILAAKTNYLNSKGIQSVWINTSELFKDLRDSFDKDENGKPISGTRASEIINLLMECEDLSLDDLGKEKPTDFVLETFYNIVNHRYEEELPTSFSTNCTAKELEDHLGAATYRRLVEPAASRMTKIRGHSFEQIVRKAREGSNTWDMIRNRHSREI
jgi:DNA replication protein DnaC